MWAHISIRDLTLCRWFTWLNITKKTKWYTHPCSNKLAKARKTRTSPSTLGLKKFGLGKLWVKKVFLAKLGHQSRKRAERGWKSEAGPLSWKRGWKPSISRSFWAIGSYCIFFPFRDMAILKCPLGRIKFPMLKYGPVECLIWGMFQWAKQAFIGTVLLWYCVKGLTENSKQWMVLNR